MSIDAAILRTEIKSGPLAAELAPFVMHGKDYDIASVLNRADRPGRRMLEIDEIVSDAMSKGYWVPIKAAASSSLDPKVRAAAITALDFVTLRKENVDIDHQSIRSLTDQLVAGGVMSKEQQDGLYALANMTMTRGEQLFGIGTVVLPSDIPAAR